MTLVVLMNTMMVTSQSFRVMGCNFAAFTVKSFTATGVRAEGGSPTAFANIIHEIRMAVRDLSKMHRTPRRRLISVKK